MNDQQQPITDEQAALVEAVLMRVAAQRIRLQQQQKGRKATGQ